MSSSGSLTQRQRTTITQIKTTFCLLMDPLPPTTVSSTARYQVGPNRRQIISEFQANAFKAIQDSMKPNARIVSTAASSERPVSGNIPDGQAQPASEAFQLFSTNPTNQIGRSAPVPRTTPVKNVHNRFKKWRKEESESGEVVEEVQFDSQFSSGPPPQYFNIQVAKMSMKKHKTWEEDGVMIVDGKKVTITVGDSTKSSNTFKLPKELVPGETQFQWEGKLVLVQDQMSPSELTASKVKSHPKVNQSPGAGQPMTAKEDESEVRMEVEQSSESEQIVSCRYSILLAKRTTKKHKTWEEDGEMRIDGATKMVTITVGESTKSSSTLKLKLPKEIIPGETEFPWEGKLVLVDQLLESSE